LVNGLAPGRPDSVGGHRSAERAKETAKPLTNPGWLGCRRTHEPVDADCAGAGETRNPVYGFAGGNLYECIPVPEYLQQRNLSRPEALIAALRAGSAADDVDCARIPRCPSWHCDGLAARYLGRQAERKGGAPPGGADARAAGDFISEPIRGWGSHAKPGWRSAPVESSPDTAKISGASQPGERLRDGVRCAVEVVGTPETTARGEDLLAYLRRNAHATHG
jgi:hypothetical protein